MGNMIGDWEVAYKELEKLISEIPQILISRDLVAIPRDLRPRFYNQLNMLSETFLVEEFPDLLPKSEQLIRNYYETKEHVCELLKLEDIYLPDSFNRFLTNPVVELTEAINQQIFNLLRREIDFNTFVEVARGQVENYFVQIYRIGYRIWATLSIISLLAPDKAFKVSTVNLDNDPLLTELDVGGLYEGSIPAPEMARCMSFKHSQLCSFIIPDIIINPIHTGKYIALRTELAEASWRASSYNDEREWHTLYLPRMEYSSSLPMDGVVVYIDRNVNNIDLISDFVKVCRPELIVQNLTYQAWQDEEFMERIIFQHKFLNPKFGTFVIIDEIMAERLMERFCMRLEHEGEIERIRFLDVEFNRENLIPIVDTILSC
jgi:hypothetical protein